MSWTTQKNICQLVKMGKEISSGGVAELKNRFKSLKSLCNELEIGGLFSGKNGRYLSRKGGKWRQLENTTGERTK